MLTMINKVNTQVNEAMQVKKPGEKTTGDIKGKVNILKREASSNKNVNNLIQEKKQVNPP